MKKLVISPSKLEQFRLFYTEAFNGFITQESIIIDIKGEKEWSTAMRFGSAFHGIIEHGPEPYYDSSSGKYIYTEEGLDEQVILEAGEIQPAIDYRHRYPNMLNEMKARHYMKVSGYDVLINMRIDGMNGLVVHERKTSKRPSDVDHYYKSLQWKCYALATDCAYVQYDIFKYTEPKKGPRKVTYIDPPYQYIPYPDIERDVALWVARLISFCEVQGLMKYITSRY